MKKSFFYGIHTADIILSRYPDSVINVYVQDTQFKKPNPRIEKLLNLASKHGLSLNKMVKTKMDNLLNDLSTRHQGIIVQCREDLLFKHNNEAGLKNKLLETQANYSQHKFFILILDEIQDPQNLGACIRSAEAMGVDFIITPERHSADITSAVCKASAGAALLLPIYRVTNLATTVRWLKEQGVWVYGTDMDTNVKLANLDLIGSSAIVMGAEGTGIRKLTRDLCDEIFTIPMKGDTQSLNVSVATGICLYEVIRQRGC